MLGWALLRFSPFALRQRRLADISHLELWAVLRPAHTRAMWKRCSQPEGAKKPEANSKERMANSEKPLLSHPRPVRLQALDVIADDFAGSSDRNCQDQTHGSPQPSPKE